MDQLVTTFSQGEVFAFSSFLCLYGFFNLIMIFSIMLTSNSRQGTLKRREIRAKNLKLNLVVPSLPSKTTGQRDGCSLIHL